MAGDLLPLKDALALMNGEFGHQQTVWGAYFAAAFAIIAAINALKFEDAKARRWVKGLATAAFLWFAYFNASVLVKIHRDQIELAAYANELLRLSGDSESKAMTSLRILTAAPSAEAWQIVATHIITDLGVVALLIFVPNWPRKSSDHSTG